MRGQDMISREIRLGFEHCPVLWSTGSDALQRFVFIGLVIARLTERVIRLRKVRYYSGGAVWGGHWQTSGIRPSGAGFPKKQP